MGLLMGVLGVCDKDGGWMKIGVHNIDTCRLVDKASEIKNVQNVYNVSDENCECCS